MRIVSEFTRISYFFESPNYESQQAKEMKEKVWQAEKSSNWMKIMNEKLKDIPDVSSELHPLNTAPVAEQVSELDFPGSEAVR